MEENKLSQQLANSLEEIPCNSSSAETLPRLELERGFDGASQRNIYPQSTDISAGILVNQESEMVQQPVEYKVVQLNEEIVIPDHLPTSDSDLEEFANLLNEQLGK